VVGGAPPPQFVYALAVICSQWRWRWRAVLWEADRESDGAAEYIRYQPSKAGGETNSGASERIIKMHEMPVDPLEPPKFKHKKAPRGPPSPPVPVMHSPPRKVSQKDMQVMLRCHGVTAHSITRCM
jgi:hypothetical protein